MKNFIQPGNVIEVPAAAANVTAGQVVAIGSLLAVANSGAASGQPYNATLSGVFEVPKVAGAAWTLGQTLMWKAASGAFAAVGSAVSGDVTGAGVSAFAAAGSADTKALVRFAGIPGTVA